jgi:hypothetical protein
MSERFRHLGSRGDTQVEAPFSRHRAVFVDM